MEHVRSFGVMAMRNAGFRDDGRFGILRNSAAVLFQARIRNSSCNWELGLRRKNKRFDGRLYPFFGR
jgi:hypothetical protein